jgi:thiosulfate dehydrogenase
MRRHIPLALALLVVVACQRPAAEPPVPSPIKMTGPLIAASMSMKAAWVFPADPLTDKTLDDSKLSQEIRRGFKLFTNTPAEAPRFAPGGMSCTNCHMNAGQRERSMPLVNVAGMFPEYNRRSGRLYSLGDRITDCFLRSENSTGSQLAADQLPNPSSPEVLAISAYLTWLARGAPVGKNPTWRGQNTITSSALVPVEKLDRAKGEAIYMDRCATCHGPDGQGVQIGDKIAGPLWGDRSWNDGAGAARVYTLAGMIRYSMPYLDPGNITDEDAQHVAAFINSKPRPAFPFKERDYRVEKLPPDAVYYTRQISLSQ